MNSPAEIKRNFMPIELVISCFGVLAGDESAEELGLTGMG